MAAALASGCGSDSEAVGAASSPDPTGRRPNVLILLTDQERYPQHWPPGLKDQLMPSWQRLRRHGLEFHRAFTASRSVLKLQKKEAQFVLNVNTGAIAFDDFNRKADILAAGAAAADKAMADLKAAWDKWAAGQH